MVLMDPQSSPHTPRPPSWCRPPSGCCCYRRVPPGPRCPAPETYFAWRKSRYFSVKLRERGRPGYEMNARWLFEDQPLNIKIFLKENDVVTLLLLQLVPQTLQVDDAGRQTEARDESPVRLPAPEPGWGVVVVTVVRDQYTAALATEWWTSGQRFIRWTRWTCTERDH